MPPAWRGKSIAAIRAAWDRFPRTPGKPCWQVGAHPMDYSPKWRRNGQSSAGGGAAQTARETLTVRSGSSLGGA